MRRRIRGASHDHIPPKQQPARSDGFLELSPRALPQALRPEASRTIFMESVASDPHPFNVFPNTRETTCRATSYRCASEVRFIDGLENHRPSERIRPTSSRVIHPSSMPAWNTIRIGTCSTARSIAASLLQCAIGRPCTRAAMTSTSSTLEASPFTIISTRPTARPGCENLPSDLRTLSSWSLLQARLLLLARCERCPARY